MANRITGLNSGMDTEALVTSLVSSYQKKVDTLQGNQKRHSWKQDAWKTLNKSTVSFYNGKLNTMSFQSSFNKKVTTASNSSAVTILTGENAMNATQKLSVKATASSAYATGGKLKGKTENDKVTGSTKLADLNGGQTNLSFSVTVGGKEEVLTFDENATVNDVVSKLKGLNVDGQKFNANFDENQGRIYMAAATQGAAGSFKFGGNAALVEALGFNTTDEHKGEDAMIILNGETYTSNTGTFEINGLTITANEIADDITITTKSDTSGIYDMVKDLFKEYNELIKQMDTAYYADPARKYNMLTEDEKEAMSEKEVEEWEKHIKDGLLSKDSTLYDVIQGMKGVMQGGIMIGDKEYHLSDFGINTGSYMTTDQNERGVYHIDGDPDDSASSANADKLKAMIASDPDVVSEFFSKLAQGMRGKLFDLMKSTQYSSSFTIYEDKLMASQYSDYNSKISDATQRLNRKQDNYYAKFTRMEKAMAKVNSVQSNLSGYFG